jgi:hypothetical protein
MTPDLSPVRVLMQVDRLSAVNALRRLDRMRLVRAREVRWLILHVSGILLLRGSSPWITRGRFVSRARLRVGPAVVGDGRPRLLRIRSELRNRSSRLAALTRNRAADLGGQRTRPACAASALTRRVCGYSPEAQVRLNARRRLARRLIREDVHHDHEDREEQQPRDYLIRVHHPAMRNRIATTVTSAITSYFVSYITDSTATRGRVRCRRQFVLRQ